LPATGAATVERLLAPAVTSRRGVTLAGQQVGPDGGWQGARITETVWPGAHGYVVTVPRMSAALVGMHLASGRRAPVGSRAFVGVSRRVNRRRWAAPSVGAVRRGLAKQRRAPQRAATPAEPPARRL